MQSASFDTSLVLATCAIVEGHGFGKAAVMSGDVDGGAVLWSHKCVTSLWCWASGFSALLQHLVDPASLRIAVSVW